MSLIGNTKYKKAKRKKVRKKKKRVRSLKNFLNNVNTRVIEILLHHFFFLLFFFFGSPYTHTHTFSLSHTTVINKITNTTDSVCSGRSARLLSLLLRTTTLTTYLK